jgi:DNA-binding transcriptional regulator YiaG
LTGNEWQVIIIKVREKFQISQETLAIYMNISTQSIINWEKGRYRIPGPALKMLNRLIKDDNSIKLIKY